MWGTSLNPLLILHEEGTVITIIPIIMNEENGAPRCEVACPKSHSQEAAELGVKSR